MDPNVDSVRGTDLAPAPVGSGDIFRRAREEQVAVAGDELLLLDPAEGRLHVLSHSAGLVYTSIDGGTTVARIADSLAVEMGTSTELIDDDVIAAVASLRDEGLIEAAVVDGVATGRMAVSVDDQVAAGSGRRRPSVGAPRSSRWDDGRARRLALSCAWTTEIGPFVAGAASVMVRSADSDVTDLLADVLRLLPAAADGTAGEDLYVVPEPGEGGRWRVYLGGQLLAKARTVDAAAEAVLAGCNVAATRHPAGAVRFHAGVVERSGRGVVVCGLSGAGKSSLTAALIGAGWGYLSDEVAIVDAVSLAITPYPKWVDLDHAAVARAGLPADCGIGPSDRKLHVPPTTIGSVGGPAVLVGLVILSGTNDDPTTAGPLSASSAIIAAMANVFATTFDLPGGLQALADVCAGTEVIQMNRAPLAEMVDMVNRTFG